MNRGNPFRCDICGRFISYADLDNGRVKMWDEMIWDYYREEPKEIWGAYHLACKKGAKE